MSRRVLIGFILVNVIVSLSVAFLVITVFGPDDSNTPETKIVTQVLYKEAEWPEGALLPEQYQGTIGAQQSMIDTFDGTARALGFQTQTLSASTTVAMQQSSGVEIPPETPLPTIDPSRLPPIPTNPPPGGDTAEDVTINQTEAVQVATEEDGCIRHVVQSGEFPITIAQEYGVLVGDLMTANGLGEGDIIREGDTLIIPNEGCALLYTPTPAPSPSNTPFALTRVVPTVTLQPTASNAQIVIVNVQGWGDPNNEVVELRNIGDRLNLQSWTLTDEEGNTFRFPEYIIQQGSRLFIYTRQGLDTPIALFWNLDTAVWTEGETVTLTDASGQVQANFRVGTLPQALPVTTPAAETTLAAE